MRNGFTLIELLVVLLLLGLAAGLVAPAIVVQREDEASELMTVLRSARDAAIRRGELLRLRVQPSGIWELASAHMTTAEPIASGRLAQSPRAPLVVLLSPLGSCAFDVWSARAREETALDPLTCEVR